MENFKKEISTLAGEQRGLKQQRKTVHFTGVRTLEPWQALMKHGANRIKLRRLNLIYGLAKGRTIEQVDANASKVFNMDSIMKEVDQLKLEFEKIKEQFHNAKAESYSAE